MNQKKKKIQCKFSQLNFNWEKKNQQNQQIFLYVLDNWLCLLNQNPGNKMTKLRLNKYTIHISCNTFSRAIF